MNNIPVSRIIVNSFLLPWSRLAYFSQALSIPALLLVSIWSIWFITSPTSAVIEYGIYFIYIVAFSYFAIVCHRLILFESDNIKTTLSINYLIVSRFVMLFIAVYLLRVIIEIIIATIYINIFTGDISGELTQELIDQHGRDMEKNADIGRYIAYLPAMYIVGRLSLVFPATSLNYQVNLKWSWKSTKNNGIRILFIIAVFPWALDTTLSVIQRENATFIEQALLGLLMFISLAIGIFALSLTYKELRSIEENKL